MDDESTPKAGPSAMVPVAIALVGVLLGGAALFFAVSNRGASTAIAGLTSDLATTQAELKSAEKHAADLDGKFSDLAQTNSSLGTQIQNVSSQVTDALNQVSKAIAQDRAQLKTQADAIQQLTAKPAPQQTTTTTASTDKTTTPTATTTATPGAGGIHVIASGDTFGSLAKKYGVTVSAIETANPDANPNRLHLGQKINIPPAPAPSAAPATSSTPPTTTPSTPAAPAPGA